MFRFIPLVRQVQGHALPEEEEVEDEVKSSLQKWVFMLTIGN